MNEKKWLVYITTIKLNESVAAGKRILNIAKSLEIRGFKILIISRDYNEYQNKNQYIELYRNIYLIGTSSKDSITPVSSIKYFTYLTPLWRTWRTLKAINFHPKAIILYGGYAPYILLLKLWLFKKNIPLFFDAVEWYDNDNKFKYFKSPRLLMIDFSIRYLLPSLDGVISISKSFFNFFKKKDVKTIHVPPLVDCIASHSNIKRTKSNPIKLVYSGSNSNALKDGYFFNIIVACIAEINLHKKCIEMDFIGMKEREFQSMTNIDNKNHLKFIKFHGYLNHDKASKIIKEADFTIFFRKNNKINTFGFPTKFSESMSYGVPVITNNSSNIQDYLIDGQNGFMCTEVNKKNIINCFKKAIQLSDKEYIQMQTNAFETAKKSFDIRCFSDVLVNFIENKDA